MKKKKEIVRWYAAGGGIKKCGPFKSQREAYQAMRLIPELIQGGCPYPKDILVWPEYSEK